MTTSDNYTHGTAHRTIGRPASQVEDGDTTPAGQVKSRTGRAPGAGVEDSDSSTEAVLYRELSEELGAKAAGV